MTIPWTVEDGLILHGRAIIVSQERKRRSCDRSINDTWVYQNAITSKDSMSTRTASRKKTLNNSLKHTPLIINIVVQRIPILQCNSTKMITVLNKLFAKHVIPEVI